MNEELLKAIENKFAELKSGDAGKEKTFQEKFANFEQSLNEIKEKSVKQEDLEKFSKSFDALSEQVAFLKEQKATAAPVTSEQFKEALTEAVTQLKERGNMKGYVQVKTLGTMSIANNVTGTMPQADREAGMTNQVRRQFTIRNGANVFGITSGTAEWVEQQNREGSASITAEGAAKPQIDWEYIVNNATVKKIPAYVKITNEMLNDIPGMMGEINGELRYKVEYAEETELLTGDGTASHLNGLTKYAQSLDLAALAGTISNPNNWDAIAAAITQIQSNTENAYLPNRIYMNPVDVFTSLHGIKKSDGEYINPVSVIINPNGVGLPQVYVLGVPVVATNAVTAGTFYVCDMTKFTIRDREAFVVSVGYENDDFTKNLVTILGEKRLVSYVKTNHQEAFVKSTFAAAKTFIEAGS
jgi:HK97 family phage major capsid protein